MAETPDPHGIEAERPVLVSSGTSPAAAAPTRERLYLWLGGALAVLVAAVLTWRFPVYFHWDDVTYLRWAQDHPNPLSAFRPAESTLFGTFRPMNLLAWWVLYRLLDLRAAGYQFVVAFLFLATLAAYYLVARRIFGGRVALFSFVGYLALFFPLGYIIFWFSDITFVLELFWIQVSLLLLLRAFDRRDRSYLWGIAAYVAAVLTKEPSVLIVTSVLLFYAWSRRRELPPWARRRAVPLVSAVALLGLAWLLLSPVGASRQWIHQVSGWSEGLELIRIRWNYYAGHLLSNAGLLLWIGALFLFGHSLLAQRIARRRLPTALLFVTAALLTVALRRDPGAALLVLLLAGLPAVVRRPEIGIAFAWGFLPLLALLSLTFFIKTYLAEASFGFALLLGLAAEALAAPWRGPARGRLNRYLKPAVALGLVAGAVVFSGLMRDKLAALRVLSDNRQNFRDVSDHILSGGCREGEGLVVIAYGDMGHSYRYGVQFMPDETKGGLQKTMEPYDLPLWFAVRGRPDIHVFQTMKEYLESASDTCCVWAMNNHETEYLRKLPLGVLPLFQVSRRGQDAGLYRVWRGGAPGVAKEGQP